MRAAVVTKPGGPEVFEIQKVDDPFVGSADLLVEVKATALNRADMAQRMGNYPSPPGIRADIPGLEMAGVVLSVGEHVREFKVGDPVFGLLGGGGYAERVVTPAAMAVRIPEGLSFIEAGSIPEVFLTAYDALFNHCDLKLGEKVLIHAIGSGVGVAALQLAKHTGAHTFGTAGTPGKLAAASSLGLDVGINYREQDFSELVKEHTDGAGVNVILDVVGASYWDRNISSLAVRGRMVLVGTMSGGKVETNIAALMPKRVRIHGTVLRARPLEEKVELTNQFKRHVLPLIASGKIRPVIDKVFSLDQVADAHDYMESNANFGKIVLQIN